MKKMAAAGMAILMGLALTACAGSGTATTTTQAAAAGQTTAAASAEQTTAASGGSGLVEEGKLYMSTNAEFAPYEYYEGDKIVGIDVEIAEAIAAKLGVELVINDIAFDSIIPEVTAGKADIGMAGMTVTEDRKQNVDFSDTYASAKQVIITNTGSAVKTAADLENKIIGVQLGTTGDIYASDVAGATLERYSKGFEAIQALSQGKIDAVILDEQPAKYYIKDQTNLHILDEAFADEQYAIAIKKGNTALVEKINKALAELKSEGTIDAIVAKYITAE